MTARRTGIATWATFVLTTALVLLLQAPAPARPVRAAVGLAGLRDLVDHRRPHTTTTYETEALAAASRHGLDPLLVLALITAESGHQQHLVSARGAVGLMQVRQETVTWAGRADPADPADNLEAGCRFLAALLDSFGGDVPLALAAYNAGPGAVRRWGTIPPYRETRSFINRVAGAYQALAGRPLPAVSRPRAVVSDLRAGEGTASGRLSGARTPGRQPGLGPESGP